MLHCTASFFYYVFTPESCNNQHMKESCFSSERQTDFMSKNTYRSDNCKVSVNCRRVTAMIIFIFSMTLPVCETSKSSEKWSSQLPIVKSDDFANQEFKSKKISFLHKTSSKSDLRQSNRQVLGSLYTTLPQDTLKVSKGVINLIQVASLLPRWPMLTFHVMSPARLCHHDATFLRSRIAQWSG